ncbi:MAG TPA: sigma-70 family RNA polymerase sigma factor [Pseudonocardiaceae bacterium]|jgi:RNA polymerase sigma factor (sigma-70 family)|nr:sigma-70 family RNA polymerase sigma factor [Pseudonocardiaceae bacterium]
MHGDPAASDAALATAAAAGDRGALAAIYDRYADRLYDFCCSVLGDRHEAADTVAEVFVIAMHRLAQLREPEKLRAWLYAVARHEALGRMRARQREAPAEQLPEPTSTEPSPEQHAISADLSRLVWDAAASLPPRDRAVLDLHLRHGLDGQELGDALGVSAPHAYKLMQRVRDTMERALGALLLARHGRRDCTELAALLADWDGQYTPVIRKRVARHVDSCDVCQPKRRALLTPLAMFSAIPIVAAPVWLREQALNPAAAAPTGTVTSNGWPGPIELTSDDTQLPKKRHAGRRAALVAAILIVLIAALTVVTLGPHRPRLVAGQPQPVTLTTTDPAQPTTAQPPTTPPSTTTTATSRTTTTEPTTRRTTTTSHGTTTSSPPLPVITSFVVTKQPTCAAGGPPAQVGLSWSISSATTAELAVDKAAPTGYPATDTVTLPFACAGPVAPTTQTYTLSPAGNPAITRTLTVSAR